MKLPLLCLTALLALPTLPAGAQTLDRIAQTGELRMGFRVDAEPLSFQDVDGNPAGYSPLICAQIAQAITNHLQLEDMTAEFVPVDTTDRFQKVADGEIDILCGAATITLARRALVDFSIPTYVDGTAVMLPNDAAEDFASLAGKRLGVRANTTTEEALRNSLLAANMTAEVIRVDDHEAGLDAMSAGELDAYFADQSILLFLYFGMGLDEQFKVSNEVLTIEKHGLALPRGDSDFRLVVDRALSEMYASGEMLRIFETALPGATPGLLLEALYLIAPTQP